MNSPLVSIGIPTFNRLDRLKRATASALAQEYENIEVIIADNASTDGTREWAQDLAKRNPRVRYWRSAANRGAVENFNRVFQLSTGGFFMWLGDDDALAENYVGECLAMLCAESSMALVAGEAVYIQDLVIDHAEHCVVHANSDDAGRRVVQYFSQVNENGVFYGLHRREVLERVGPMKNRMGGDWLLLARVAHLGRIETISTTVIWRDLGGATQSLAHIARSHGLTSFEGRFPHLSIAGLALADEIRWEGSAEALGSRRYFIACEAGWAVVRRFVIPKLRRRARRRLSDVQILRSAHRAATNLASRREALGGPLIDGNARGTDRRLR